MRSLSKVALIVSIALLPATAFALEGIGRRVTITGSIQEVRISDKQKFEEYGGEMSVRASNGQMVTVIFEKDTKIITEGRLSRKTLLPSDLQLKSSVRISGLRVDSKTMKASLLVITNVENNPVLSGNGVTQGIGDNTVMLLVNNGETKTFTVTTETEIYISYTLWGNEGLSLLNKLAYYTLNPNDPTQLRVLRIVGKSTSTPTAKPSTTDFGRR